MEPSTAFDLDYQPTKSYATPNRTSTLPISNGLGVQILTMLANPKALAPEGASAGRGSQSGSSKG